MFIIRLGEGCAFNKIEHFFDLICELLSYSQFRGGANSNYVGPRAYIGLCFWKCGLLTSRIIIIWELVSIESKPLLKTH